VTSRPLLPPPFETVFVSSASGHQFRWPPVQARGHSVLFAWLTAVVSGGASRPRWKTRFWYRRAG